MGLSLDSKYEIGRWLHKLRECIFDFVTNKLELQGVIDNFH